MNFVFVSKACILRPTSNRSVPYTFVCVGIQNTYGDATYGEARLYGDATKGEATYGEATYGDDTYGEAMYGEAR